MRKRGNASTDTSTQDRFELKKKITFFIKKKKCIKKWPSSKDSQKRRKKWPSESQKIDILCLQFLRRKKERKLFFLQKKDNLGQVQRKKKKIYICVSEDNIFIKTM